MKWCNKAADFFKCALTFQTHTCERGAITIERPNTQQKGKHVFGVRTKEGGKKQRKKE